MLLSWTAVSRRLMFKHTNTNLLASYCHCLNFNAVKCKNSVKAQKYSKVHLSEQTLHKICYQRCLVPDDSCRTLSETSQKQNRRDVCNDVNIFMTHPVAVSAT